MKLGHINIIKGKLNAKQTGYILEISKGYTLLDGKLYLRLTNSGANKLASILKRGRK